MDPAAPFALGPRVAQWVELLPALPLSIDDVLDSRRERRRQQFEAGRRAAARMLNSLGATEAVVGVGPLGSPLWPTGFAGSITHKHDLLAVAVARTGEASSIGIDIEAWVSDAVAGDIEQICLDAQEKALAAVAGVERAWFATVAFSAKEALYKCLFPTVGEFFDFSAARIVRIDAQSGALHLQLTRSLGSHWARGCVLEGRFRTNLSHVFSSIELPPK